MFVNYLLQFILLKLINGTALEIVNTVFCTFYMKTIIRAVYLRYDEAGSEPSIQS